MLAKFASTGDPDETAREMQRSIATIAWLMPLIVGVSVFFVREAVVVLLPKYLPGVPALSILLFGSLGLALSSVPSFYIMAIQKQVKLLPLAVGAVVLDIGLIALFLKLGWKLEGVALGVSIGYVVYGVGLLVYAASHLSGSRIERGRFVLRSVLPTLWAAALALAFAVLLPPLFPGMPGWVLAFIETGLFVALYLLAARTLRPRTGIVGLMKESQWPVARLIAGAWARE
jgi:O-antigen/teichoic acid export membrane protein